MLKMLPSFAARDRDPSGDLPRSPDEIDLDRIVNDPDYRRAVQALLKRWGFCERGISGGRKSPD